MSQIETDTTVERRSREGAPRPARAPDSKRAAALAAGTEVYEELAGAAGERTLDILEMRRKTAARKRRGWLVRRMLLLADLVGLTVAYSAAQLLTGGWVTDDGNIDPSAENLVFLCTLPVWIVLAKVYGLYARDEERTDHTTADDLVGVFHLGTVGVWLLFAATSLTGLGDPDVPKVVVFWALAISAVTGARGAARVLSRRQLAYFQNTVIVGTGEVGQMIARKYLARPDYGINIVGFIDDEPLQLHEPLDQLPVLGGFERLPLIAKMFDVERVVFAFSRDSHQDTLDLISSLKDLDVQIDVVPRLFEVIGPRVDVHLIEGVPIIGLPPLKLSRSSLMIKRGMDVLLAGAGLAVLSPLIVATAILVRLDSRGPSLYRAPRVGREGRVFSQLKFRTMRLEFCRGDEYGAEAAEAEFERLLEDPKLRAEFEHSHKLARDPRVTRVGRFLRRTSLDELPQLLNVVRGDLSLVGPRPIATDEYAHLDGNENGSARKAVLVSGRPHRLRGYWEIPHLRPGLTGFWQITGRSSVDHLERIRLDMAYVTSWSLELDLMILAKTLRALISSHGAY